MKDIIISLIFPAVCLVACRFVDFADDTLNKRVKMILFALAPISYTVAAFVMFDANPIETMLKSLLLLDIGLLFVKPKG